MRIITGFNKAKKLLDRFHYEGIYSNLSAKNTKNERIVERIINTVIQKGDIALYEYTLEFDQVKLNSLEVTKAEIVEAKKQISKDLIDDLTSAADRIANFHQNCRDRIITDFEVNNLGKKIRALDKIGIYVPGGSAAYPSTVFMTAIPAKIAGVSEVIMVSPPQKDGKLPPVTIMAAQIAGVDRIFKVGGAQAIAALAYGTISIPKVDMICGPGNIFVSLAKKLVYGTVHIDGIQGPSEIVIIADGSANPSYCAADLLAQAEHDELAISILITDSESIAEAAQTEIDCQIQFLSRKNLILESLKNRGLIIIVGDVTEAIELANLFAPEHLMLMIKDARKYLNRIFNAGCVFLGNSSPVVMGDYIAGPSHVLPTGGTARFSSPLGIESFLRTMNYVALNKRQYNLLGPTVIRLARYEGLDAHAQSINIRLK